MTPRVFTVRAQRAGSGTFGAHVQHNCGERRSHSQVAGGRPSYRTGRGHYICGAKLRFTGLKEPLAVWNLRPLKPDGTLLALGHGLSLLQDLPLELGGSGLDPPEVEQRVNLTN